MRGAAPAGVAVAVAAALLTTSCAASPPAAGRAAAQHAVTSTTTRPAFHYAVRRVTIDELGKSWHRGCPVRPRRLRSVRMTVWGFDKVARRGSLIVNVDAVPAVVHAFRAMYAARFPIRRMRPIAVYGADDDVSMAHDNTSAFNCRKVSGTSVWSVHAYGRAVDVNPVENPYVVNGTVSPPAGKPYADRTDWRPGMVLPRHVPVKAFAYSGWGWGGNWLHSKDYQHFSSNGK